MLIQNTAEWHAWREAGLGSSDAPVIMGVSPWRTPLQLWQERKGLISKQVNNWAMQRGHDLEPAARACYELRSDLDMPAALVEHPHVPFVRASLDGYNREARRILEIKCPGEKDHAEAEAGRIPEKYVWQLVHQLMAAQAEQVDYFSFRNKRGVLVPFKRDPKLELQLLEAEIEFWRKLQNDIPPDPIAGDLPKKKRTPKTKAKGWLSGTGT